MKQLLRHIGYTIVGAITLTVIVGFFIGVILFFKLIHEHVIRFENLLAIPGIIGIAWVAGLMIFEPENIISGERPVSPVLDPYEEFVYMDVYALENDLGEQHAQSN